MAEEMEKLEDGWRDEEIERLRDREVKRSRDRKMEMAERWSSRKLE